MTDNQSAMLQASAQLAGTAANVVAQGRTNKKTRQWNEHMYNQQKQDSLDSWHMQNQYNSPQAQMARLQEAGLNPNLVYGTGAVANSTSSPDVPSAMPYKPQSPDFNIPQVVDGYFDTKFKHQQLSNQKQQGDLIALDKLVKLQEVRTKKNLNDYMESHGFTYKRESEKNKANQSFEDWLRVALNNEFMSGNPGGPGSNNNLISPGSGYDLQGKAMELTNKLRRSELQGKGYRNETDKVKSQYIKRTMSGELKDMSSKDIMTLLIQGLGLTK